MNNKTNLSRRSFLKRAGMSPIAPFLSYLPLAGGLATSSAQAADDDYKSLVCVFLLGGADSFSFVAPEANSTLYEDYLTTRGDFAVARDDLLATNDGFGFNKSLSGLHQLYEQQQLAVIANVGNLVKPTTKADLNTPANLPQSLFAHDAQQKLWQTGSGKLTDSLGWGGSISEHLDSRYNTGNLKPSISVNGSPTWLSNLHSSYISLNPGASIDLMRGYNTSDPVEGVLNQWLTEAKASDSVFQQAMADKVVSAHLTSSHLSAAMAQNPVSEMSVSGKLSTQLHTIARLISARETLNMGRQVFFVGLGGWDTHKFQAVSFPTLLAELNDSLTEFQRVINQMGKADTVTTFTASEFGRTLTSNGSGTDHGWGGNAFVMGGAVNGGKMYGELPQFKADNNPDDSGDESGNFAGRIIPKIAVAQYGATLTSWMGVSDAQRDTIFPNLNNFSTKNLGFFR